MGSGLYNGLDIWEWDGGEVGDYIPTGIIFSNHGSPQTADLNFVNGAYYDQNGLVTLLTGDVNFDGIVSSTDITILYNLLLDNDQTYAFHADVNGDGVVTATDITVIYNILLGN